MLGKAKDKPQGEFEERINVIAVVLVLVFGILVVRLWELQVVRWSEFTGKAQNNSLRIQRLESPRGMIVARDGAHDHVVVADNRAARDLMFVPADCSDDYEAVCARLETLAGIDGVSLLRKIEDALEARQPHRQIILKRDVARSVLARVEEYAFLLPGVFTVVRPQRRYLFGKVGGQILGYLGEIGPEELRRSPAYHMGDLLGRAGLERRYEDGLRGEDGHMLVTKYARGRPQLRTDPYGRSFVKVDDFGHTLVEEEVHQPKPGTRLNITLDMGIQAKSESLLENKEGAIVVLNAETGAILAMASSPGYDPGIFVTRGMSRQRFAALQDEPSRMLNRAFQQICAPGSIFKILLASAAIEEGVIDEETSFYCPGKFRLSPNGRPWHCWRRSGHGKVKVVDALAFSCDVFFYNVGLGLGVDRIHEWSTRAGLGARTGIDLPGEEAGLVPSREWKIAQLNPDRPHEPWEYRWYPGDTLNLSIGQGALATTPLQNALIMASIINGGRLIRPHLNRDEDPAEGPTLWSEFTLALIRRGLLKCVQKGPPAPTGTGHEAHIPGLDILGKTGTAQMVSLAHHQQYETEEDIPKHLRDHAWFVAGTPNTHPPLALCVLIEHGQHGGSVAAPMAKEIMNYIFNRGSDAQLAKAL